MGIQTNIFLIKNLGELSSDYRLYRIKGLHPDQSEYFQNRQYIKRKLSYVLQKPVTVVDRENAPYLVVRSDAQEPPSPFPLVRTSVIFEPVGGVMKLDFSVRSAENDEICLRFLQFMVQEPLHNNPHLWQPAAGQPFFQREPTSTSKNLVQYTGWSVRATITQDGGLGFCVDSTNKFASQTPLPVHLTHDQFVPWKNKHCIYHYGHRWYEVQLLALSDLNATEYTIKKDNRRVNLLDFIVEDSKKPIPPELAQLPHDTSVVLYKNNKDEDRGAPAPLCYPVYGTDDEEVANLHDSTVPPPHKREQTIYNFVSRYMSSLRFGNVQVRIANRPVDAPTKFFTVPDLKFKSGLLSVRGTPGARNTSLGDLGKERLNLLKETGFYQSDPLDRQYCVLPQSVLDSFGNQFLRDLKKSVDELFPQEQGYDPIVVKYNDRVPKTVLNQGRAILEAVDQECQKPGYAVVMLHRTTDQRLREEDKLAGMITRELRKRDISAAVMHSTTGQECYQMLNDSKGAPYYQVLPNKRGKLSGYLRNIAINKVLLTNQRWPFVLGTPLHADVTIGIDVKQNTAGLVVIGRSGDTIRPLLKTSKQKERLDADSLKSYLVEILRPEAQGRDEKIKEIVVHRDGRIFQTELEAIHEAITLLKNSGVLDGNATATILELPKSSPAPLRLFEVSERERGRWTENPQVGTYYIVNSTDGYLCSTGRAFPKRGTVSPLHVRRIEGSLSIENCLEDIYYLTTLTWTRPEDCTRYPITMKLNDRFLGEEATDYDADALEAMSTLESEVADE